MRGARLLPAERPIRSSPARVREPEAGAPVPITTASPGACWLQSRSTDHVRPSLGVSAAWRRRALTPLPLRTRAAGTEPALPRATLEPPGLRGLPEASDGFLVREVDTVVETPPLFVKVGDFLRA